MRRPANRPSALARLAHFWGPHGWKVIAALWLVSLGLALIGFRLHAAAGPHSSRLPDIAYRTLQLIPMNSGDVDGAPWPLDIARFLIPFLAAWTAVRAFLSFFRDRWQHALVRFWRGHVVVCGLSRKGWLLAQGFAARGERVVVIEADESHDLIGPCRERGIPVLIGDATDPDLLARAGVLRARHIIAVTDDDGINAEISVRCHHLLAQRGRGEPARTHRGSLTCTVHLVDPELYELARTRELALEENVPLRLELFNVFQRGARLLWGKYGPDRTALESPAAGEAGCAYHAVVIGLGRLGESLIVTAGRDWYAALHETPCRAGGRLRFSVVDEDAERKCRALRLRYPQLASICELAPFTTDVGWPEFYAGDFLRLEPPGGGPPYPPIRAVFVCFDDDSMGLRTGLTVHQQLLRRGAGHTPVVVRMAEASGLARLIDLDGGEAAGLHAFPLLDRTCTPEAILGGTHEVLARGLHEAYLQGLHTPEQAAGNPVAVPWEALPARYRESSAAEMKDLLRHLALLGYTVAPLTDWDAGDFRFPAEDAERLAEREHGRWYAERWAQGWRPTDGLRDEAHKLTPALVPWAEVSPVERKKTLDTVNGLPRTLARAGFQIVRSGAAQPARVSERERLARALHEQYRKHQEGIKPADDPAMQPWESLPAALADSNRSTAEGIDAALAAAGYAIRAAQEGHVPAVVFTPAEVETMAAVVHARWVADRIDDGWHDGPRDVDRKTTPYLLPYEALPDDVKEWDRQVVRSIPDVLGQAQLEVYRPADGETTWGGQG